MREGFFFLSSHVCAGGGGWYATSRSRVTAKVCGDGNQLKKKVVGANGQLFF